MKVLWLASWYPNRTNPSNGDFVERHAKAVATQVDSIILMVVTKDEAMQRGTVEIIKTTEANLTVYKAYYGKSKWGGLIEKLLSFKTYYSIQKQIYNKEFSGSQKPDIVHVQVAMKAGLFAKQLKKKLRIPYIVTEHWAGYYKACTPNIYDKGNNFIRLTNSVLSNASLFCPVSKDLGKIINKNFTSIKFDVVPNVVDTKLFFYKQESSPAKCRFIHPSYMNFQKNPEGILTACKILKEKGVDFELQMIGNNNTRLIELAKEMGLLNSYVFFEAAVAYGEVATKMQESSALLLFSRFENLPCVILEALCCGLPVISTNVGGIAEVIDDSNGLLVQNENVEELAGAMQQMIDKYTNYANKDISLAATALYNYNTVAKKYVAIYKRVADDAF